MNPWPWIETLGRASVEGGLLILAVWALTRTWRGAPAWVRAALWWLACARLMLGLLPLVPVSVSLPALPVAAWWPAAVAAPSPAIAPALDLPAPPAVAATARLAPQVEAARVVAPSRPAFDPAALALALLGLWLLGVAIRAFRLLRHAAEVCRVCRDSRALPPRLESALALLLPSGTRLAASAAVPAPMVTGLRRPVVLLPAALMGHPASELRLAVAHEAEHVRRGDLWMAWLPALAETVFWFHPLVALCGREYVQACEEDCDARALRATGASPYDYGRLLVALGVRRRSTGVTAMPFGTQDRRQLTRRLSMLQNIAPLGRRARRVALVLLAGFALVGLAPLRLIPASATADPPPAAGAPVAPDIETAEIAPSVEPGALPLETEKPAPLACPPGCGDPVCDSPAAAALAHAAEQVTPETAPVADWDEDPDAEPPVPPVPPAPPHRPAPPAPVVAPEPVDVPDPVVTPLPAGMWLIELHDETLGAHKSRAARARAVREAKSSRKATSLKTRRTGVTWAYGSGDSRADRFAYVLVRGEQNMSGSGNEEDWQDVKSLQDELDQDFLWARVGQERYVIVDREILDRVEEALEPQREIGERQSRLGQMQSKIGGYQSEIGRRQTRIGREQARIGQMQGRLAQRMAERSLQRRATDDLEAAMEELGEEMDRLGEQMEELSRSMEPLSSEQAELGEQMGELGRRMETAAREGMRRVRSLVQEAVRSGAARPLR